MDADKRHKKLISSRQHFNEWSKNKTIKWQKENEMKEKKRSEEEQKKEMNRIERELNSLRDEYERILGERGLAHRHAAIIEAQDHEIQLFIKRRNTCVTTRAQQVLHDEHNKMTQRQKSLQEEKQAKIKARRELMKGVSFKENYDSEDIRIIKRLSQLERAENALKKLIANKKQVNCSEKSIEGEAKKMFFPTKLLTQQELLKNNVEAMKSCESNAYHFESNERKIKHDTFCQTEGDANNIYAKPDLPLYAASRLLKVLNEKKFQINDHKNNKIVRNMATNTSILDADKKLTQDVNYRNSYQENMENDNSLFSSATSYLSLPSTHLASSKTTKSLSQLYKNHLLNKGNTSSSKSSNASFNSEVDMSPNATDNNVDQLLSRINHLKSLINQKIGENQMNKLNEVTHSSTADTIKIRKTSSSKADDFVSDHLSTIQESESDPIISQYEAGNNQISKETSSRPAETLIKGLEFDEMSTSVSSTSFKTIPALTFSNRSLSPFDESNVEDINNDTLTSLQTDVSEGASASISFSQFERALAVPDRPKFWSDVFCRAGININEEAIEQFLREHPLENESLSTKNAFDFNKRHSTPIHFSLDNNENSFQ